MGDNIIAEHPDKDILRLCCVRCPHMNEITLADTLRPCARSSTRWMCPKRSACAPRKSVERMIAIRVTTGNADQADGADFADHFLKKFRDDPPHPRHPRPIHLESFMTSELITTDVLIIGSGIAGCTTALDLADAGVNVLMVTRAEQPEDSNTLWAQGGIIYEGDDDSPELLAEDILHAGAGHSYPPAVSILANEGPPAVERVLFRRAPTPFDRDETGKLELGLEGGHSLPRIIHATDATGKAIELSLLNQVAAHPNIELLTGHTAIDLLSPSHNAKDRLVVYQQRRCVGAYVLERETQVVKRIVAKKTVLASGGLGRIFLRTTNPAGARGDGIAMAYRTGVRVINAEFVQFHPTAFFKQNNARFLISEAVRGAGARLVDIRGRPFMEKYDAKWGDLAPRDVDFARHPSRDAGQRPAQRLPGSGLQHDGRDD